MAEPTCKGSVCKEGAFWIWASHPKWKWMMLRASTSSEEIESSIKIQSIQKNIARWELVYVESRRGNEGKELKSGINRQNFDIE